MQGFQFPVREHFLKDFVFSLFYIYISFISEGVIMFVYKCVKNQAVNYRVNTIKSDSQYTKKNSSCSGQAQPLYRSGIYLK